MTGLVLSIKDSNFEVLWIIHIQKIRSQTRLCIGLFFIDKVRPVKFELRSSDSSFVLSYLITTVLFSDEESNTSTYREDSSRRPSSEDDAISDENDNPSDEDFQENEPLRHTKAKKSKKKEVFKKVDNRKNKNPKKTVSKKHRDRVEKEPAPATSSSENTSE